MWKIVLRNWERLESLVRISERKAYEEMRQLLTPGKTKVMQKKERKYNNNSNELSSDQYLYTSNIPSYNILIRNWVMIYWKDEIMGNVEPLLSTEETNKNNIYNW